EATIQRLFDFLELKGDTKEIARREVQPPTTLGRWRKQGAKEIAALERVANDALKRFGYL
ncbi:MAG TPA: hypothetical protein VEF04_08920, partial [Blastocatellia bacterium]|nr:hypothetical protein [Blastocatellia bacterium]